MMSCIRTTDPDHPLNGHRPHTLSAPQKVPPHVPAASAPSVRPVTGLVPPPAPPGRNLPAAVDSGPGSVTSTGTGRGPARQARLLVPNRPENVARARRWLRTALARWAVPEEAADVAALLLSESLTNAVVHARDTVRILVTVGLSNGRLRCEVGDQDPGWAAGPLAHRTDGGHARCAEDLPESGRGLPLLDTLATAWGVRRGGRGKAVWFVVRPAGEPPGPAEAWRPRPAGQTLSHARGAAGAGRTPGRRPVRTRRCAGPRVRRHREDRRPGGARRPRAGRGAPGAARRPRPGRAGLPARRVDGPVRRAAPGGRRPARPGATAGAGVRAAAR
ncbi:hypothetical protein DN402_32865 [Streptomyces sp. SW4]|nr:hypothetical protein DN402_32865 [Streptomyces sp. SW4]